MRELTDIALNLSLRFGLPVVGAVRDEVLALCNLSPLRPVAGERANSVANGNTVPQNVSVDGGTER